MITTTVKTTGFREMEDLLFQMRRSTAKNTVSRAMIASLEPTRDLARTLAPRDSGELRSGIEVSKRATNAKRTKKSDLEIYVGPRKNIGHAVLQEFGTVNHGPNPFMRPAWDATKVNVLTSFSFLVWEGVEKSIARAERKAAREAAKIKRGK